MSRLTSRSREGATCKGPSRRWPRHVLGKYTNATRQRRTQRSAAAPPGSEAPAAEPGDSATAVAGATSRGARQSAPRAAVKQGQVEHVNVHAQSRAANAAVSAGTREHGRRVQAAAALSVTRCRRFAFRPRASYAHTAHKRRSAPPEVAGAPSERSRWYTAPRQPFGCVRAQRHVPLSAAHACTERRASCVW
jgi:hypothetical protein